MQSHHQNPNQLDLFGVGEGLESLRAPPPPDASPRRRKAAPPPRLAAALRLLSTELSFRAAEPGPSITGPVDAGRLLVELIGMKDREHFTVLHLDTRNRIIGAETVSVGTLSAALVHPREVFKSAILANSQSIICGHNHPSGHLNPSNDDIAIYQRLRQVGTLLGIEVLDCLIVSSTDHRRVAFP